MKANDLKAKTSLPLIIAPMFLVSNPDLAIGACKEGAVGSFPALNQLTSAGLEQWLIRMNTELADLQQKNPDQKIAPYAVNLIVNKTNKRLEDDLALCVKHKVPVIITSLGISPELIKAVHSYGGIVLHDVTNLEHAKKAAAAGVDGIIAVAAGAGGHAGTMNPISLVREIRGFYDGLLVLAGGMSSGQDILAAEAMGADFAYMGTRFISTNESNAFEDYKKMVVDAKSSDVIYTPAVSGIPANFLRQSLENAGYKIEDAKKTDGKLKPMDDHEAKAWKDVWSAGHGVGVITDRPSVATLMQRLKKEYAEASQKFAEKLRLKQKPPAP